MYKINYREEMPYEDMVENISSIIIDVRDIDQMKCVDVAGREDINLLTLYVRCLKYYRSRPRLNERFVINNNYKDNKKITRAILDCDWLINEDDVVYNLDKLEEKAESFRNEIDFISDSDALKDIHKCTLMRYYLNSLKSAKRRIGITDEKRLKLTKDV